ncbi:MAG: 2Fe-2S iron-sulfur cluster-binding protein [Flavobacteriaceae bacterium]
MEFSKHTIHKIVKETEQSVSLYFNKPQDFSFFPGQYITIKHEIEGKELRRSYSLSSRPDQDLRIGIKAVENGLFSNFAMQLKAGETLEFSQAEGRFLLDPAHATENSNYLAIAAGSGVTPILSMVHSVLEDTKASFTLIYGNKSPLDAMYLQELQDLAASYDRFSLIEIYSRNCPPDGRLGRIDSSIINFALNKGTFDQVFICGPEALINDSKAHLITRGFTEDQINFELFSSATSSDESESANSDDQVSISVVLDDETHEFKAPRGINLLDAVLDQDLDAPYSCKGGVCSSCIALVTEGSAKMEKNNILTDSEIEEGLTITCQAHATTDRICLDFDEA